MKIKTIHIKNFKSIKEITIDCNEGINAFIGKNGTGKSAVFDAVNFVLGKNKPTKNNQILIQEQNNHFYYNDKIELIRKGEEEAKITITLEKNGEEVIVECDIKKSKSK